MELGNRWLGRDPFTGEVLTQPDITGLSPLRFRELTTEPRRYGFHGTLRAPFHKRKGLSETDLLRTCETFAANTTPFRTTGLSVNTLGKFLALTPSQPDAELRTFAESCLRAFEPCRAPLSDADLARRRSSGLSPRQDEHLQAWGYPYVFDEFRFHMTLSNKLEDETERNALTTAAKTYFADITEKPDTVDTFGLYFEPERGAPFTVHTIFSLTGVPATADAHSLSTTK